MKRFGALGGSPERLAIGAVVALMAAGALDTVASLTLRPLTVLSVWSAVLSVATLFLLDAQRRLLPRLFSGAATPSDDPVFVRFRRLYAFVIAGATVQLGVVTLALVTAFDAGVTDGLDPNTTFLVLGAWAFSIFASFRTFRAYTAALRLPLDKVARGALREWLTWSAVSGALFALLNLLEGTRDGLKDPTDVVLMATYLLVSLFDTAVPLLVRRAFRPDALTR